jgi:predicted DNA-binding transcriptional regulator AlpA
MQTGTSERFSLRVGEVAETIGISRRSFERLRAAGKFPPPDRQVGRMPLWRPATVDRWLAGNDAANVA